MKYNININQLVLADTQLDLIDCAILDYLQFLCASVNKKVEKERVDGFTWVNYKSLLEDMPLLKIKSTSALGVRVRRIEEGGFIETIKNKTNRLYVKPTEKMETLCVKTHSPMRVDAQPPMRQNAHDNITNIDNTTNNNPAAPEPAAGNPVNEVLFSFRDINPSYKRFYSNKTQRAAAERLITQYGAERVKEMVAALPKIVSMPYAPKVTSPYELERDMGKLKAFAEQQKSTKKVITISTF